MELIKHRLFADYRLVLLDFFYWKSYNDATVGEKVMQRPAI